MTRVFTEDGISIPVTVVKYFQSDTQVNCLNAMITRSDSKQQRASVKRSRLNKPEIGHFSRRMLNQAVDYGNFG